MDDGEGVRSSGGTPPPMNEPPKVRLSVLQLIIVISCAASFITFTAAEVLNPTFETPVFVWAIIGSTFGAVMGFSYKGKG